MENRYLFRGKRVDNGEWAFGYYAVIDGDSYINIYDRHPPSIEIIPETLGQCTGLIAAKSYRGESETDRLVFEGDMLKFKYGRGYKVAATGWANGRYYLRDIDTRIIYDLDFRELEIIGTMHDN